MKALEFEKNPYDTKDLYREYGFVESLPLDVLKKLTEQNQKMKAALKKADDVLERIAFLTQGDGHLGNYSICKIAMEARQALEVK